MSEIRCAQVRERIPDLVAERLEEGAARAIHEHVRDCAACTGEAELVRMLYERRAGVSPELAQAVKAALAGRTRPQRSRIPWWGFAAAAVAVVALGFGVGSWSGSTRPDAGAVVDAVPGFALDEDVLWLSEDGEIAGAPTLEDVPDEALVEFLDELNGGGTA